MDNWLLVFLVCTWSGFANSVDNFEVLKVLSREGHITLCGALVLNATTVLALTECAQSSTRQSRFLSIESEAEEDYLDMNETSASSLTSTSSRFPVVETRIAVQIQIYEGQSFS